MVQRIPHSRAYQKYPGRNTSETSSADNQTTAREVAQQQRLDRKYANEHDAIFQVIMSNLILS